MEFTGEIDREHDLRQLALAVGPRAAVAARQHDIGEIERLLPGGRHIDDAGRRALLDQRQQETGQQEAGQIVDGKAQLVPVGAHLLRRARAAGADAGIVDQDVEPIRPLLDCLGKAAHLGQGGEIPRQEFR